MPTSPIWLLRCRRADLGLWIGRGPGQSVAGFEAISKQWTARHTSANQREFLGRWITIKGQTNPNKDLSAHADLRGRAGGRFNVGDGGIRYAIAVCIDSVTGSQDSFCDGGHEVHRVVSAEENQELIAGVRLEPSRDDCARKGTSNAAGHQILQVDLTNQGILASQGLRCENGLGIGEDRSAGGWAADLFYDPIIALVVDRGVWVGPVG